jgi:two-component system OmpR family sensor kinase/two-component system sensor histidine kinase BaeS
MKLPLFWTMLLAFVLVIVLGMAGTFTAFGLAVTIADREEAFEPMHEGRDTAREAFGATLADYYVARGGSWAGLDERVAALERPTMLGFSRMVVVDAQGRVVASVANLPTGMQLPPEQIARGEPVRVEGIRVGTLLFVDGRLAGAERESGPPPFFWRMARGVLAGLLGFGAVLFGLAVLFAGRISRPIRGLTVAAQSLAAGRLDVQVPGASVREIDELARSFNRMARSLEDADRQRRQMTADIAHELRTPLAVIKGRLEGMQDGIYAATPEQIERLLNESALLERLIDDLRLLALAEAGQLPLYFEPTDLAALLERAAATFADQAARQHVALQVEAQPALPEAQVDPQRMAQVLANLVGNALRYTPAGGTICLRARSQGTQALVVEVADSGQGIEPEHLPHVFERFYRADRARVRMGGGAGLGLAISRQIIVAHGGEITVQSTPGKGTAFVLRLPTCQEGRR